MDCRTEAQSSHTKFLLTLLLVEVAHSVPWSARFGAEKPVLQPLRLGPGKKEQWKMRRGGFWSTKDLHMPVVPSLHVTFRQTLLWSLLSNHLRVELISVSFF